MNITIDGGKTVKLKTAGKYCDRDITVTATGGGGGGEINTGTCTVKITVPAAGNYYYAYEKISNGAVVYQIDRNYVSANATSTKTVRCDSVMYIQGSGIKGSEISDGELIRFISNYGLAYKTPSTASTTIQITLTG